MTRRGRISSTIRVRQSPYKASNKIQTKAPNLAAAASGRNSSIGPAITKPHNATPRAAVSRVPVVNNGLGDRLMIPSSSK